MDCVSNNSAPPPPAPLLPPQQSQQQQLPPGENQQPHQLVIRRNGEKLLRLGAGEKFASVTVYKGEVKVHVREYLPPNSGNFLGDYIPTKRGVTLSPAEFGDLMRHGSSIVDWVAEQTRIAEAPWNYPNGCCGVGGENNADYSTYWPQPPPQSGGRGAVSVCSPASHNDITAAEAGSIQWEDQSEDSGYWDLPPPSQASYSSIDPRHSTPHTPAVNIAANTTATTTSNNARAPNKRPTTLRGVDTPCGRGGRGVLKRKLDLANE